MVCSSCYWKPELKDCKSDNSLSLTEMIGTTAKELPSKRALELSELKLITMFKTVSTLERGLGVERAKTPFFRGLPRRPTKLDDIHAFDWSNGTSLLSNKLVKHFYWLNRSNLLTGQTCKAF
jgi:hypothetical protein